LHIQYSHDDDSIVIVNSTYRLHNLVAHTEVLDFNLKTLFKNTTTISVNPDSTQPVLTLPKIPNLTQTYFVRLDLRDISGTSVSQNFYWLSTQKEVMDWDKTDFTHTPTLVDGDLTLLNTLPQVHVSGSINSAKGSSVVTLQNQGTHIAFFVRLKITQGKSGEEILPVLWQDNYITLMPGEIRQIQALYDDDLLKGNQPVLELSGWNL
jgi:exo-1,4-beta-D-glucosaminidase